MSAPTKVNNATINSNKRDLACSFASDYTFEKYFFRHLVCPAREVDEVVSGSRFLRAVVNVFLC